MGNMIGNRFSGCGNCSASLGCGRAEMPPKYPRCRVHGAASPKHTSSRLQPRIISISIGEQKGKGEEARRHVREDSGRQRVAGRETVLKGQDAQQRAACPGGAFRRAGWPVRQAYLDQAAGLAGSSEWTLGAAKLTFLSGVRYFRKKAMPRPRSPGSRGPSRSARIGQCAALPPLPSTPRRHKHRRAGRAA